MPREEPWEKYIFVKLREDLQSATNSYLKKQENDMLLRSSTRKLLGRGKLVKNCSPKF